MRQAIINFLLSIFAKKMVAEFGDDVLRLIGRIKKKIFKTPEEKKDIENEKKLETAIKNGDDTLLPTSDFLNSKLPIEQKKN